MDPNTIDDVINVVSFSMPWMTIIAGCIGGIIVFVFGKLSNLVLWKLTRPKLKVEFDKKTQDCISYTTDNGRPVVYVRMKATSYGRFAVAARGCRAYLTNVEKRNKKGEFESTVYCDSIRLAWSCQRLPPEQFGLMDIPSKVNQYIDIVSLLQEDHKFEPRVEGMPNRYIKMFQQTGTFLFTVYVHAENASPVKCKLIFTWRHPWDGNKDSDAFEAQSYKD